MPSSTDTARPLRGPGAWLDAGRDLGHLVRFRGSTIRRRGLAVASLVLVVALTALLAFAPADLDAARNPDVAELVRLAREGLEGRLPMILTAVFVLALASAIGSGGGRELLSRSEVAIHPVGPVTEHLGALTLAPLNLAWLVQAWGLLAVTSLIVEPGRLAGAQVVVVVWVVAVTAVAQAVGWAVEGVRRTTHGVLLVRVGTGAVALLVLGLHLAGRLGEVAASLPTSWVATAMLGGAWPSATVVLIAVTAVAVWLGAIPARWALGLPPREELRVESGVHEARPTPTSRWLSADVALLRRLDRGSVWRSVGMRRGLVVLGIAPGLVALVSGMEWASVLMLPGLAASGGALLFGVNAWCLDGRGMVWRESLPAEPSAVFAARTLVTGECMALVSAVTIAVAAVRAGMPSGAVAAAVLTCWVVVVVQVLAISMSWSVRRPYSMDLSSPRATPAPHVAMAGYAARLSLVTTLTGLFFSGLAVIGAWWVSPAFGAVFLTWSGVRLWRARRRWLSAPERAQIALTVAAV